MQDNEKKALVSIFFIKFIKDALFFVESSKYLYFYLLVFTIKSPPDWKSSLKAIINQEAQYERIYAHW